MLYFRRLLHRLGRNYYRAGWLLVVTFCLLMGVFFLTLDLPGTLITDEPTFSTRSVMLQGAFIALLLCLGDGVYLLYMRKKHHLRIQSQRLARRVKGKIESLLKADQKTLAD